MNKIPLIILIVEQRINTLCEKIKRLTAKTTRIIQQQINNNNEMAKLIDLDGCEGLGVYDDCPAANLKRLFFCRWLQNHTRTTFFFKSSLSAIWAIRSPLGRCC